jgi:hypothetical protein
MSIRLIGALLGSGVLALVSTTGTFAQSGIIPTLEAHTTVKKSSKGENENPRPTDRVYPGYNYQEQNRSGKSNTSDRMGGGGGKGAAQQKGTGSGAGKVSVQDLTIRKASTTPVEFPNARPKALSEPPRGGPGPTDLPGRR